MFSYRRSWFYWSRPRKKLVNFGYEVTVIDNLITGKLNNLNGYLKKIRFLRSN